MRAQRSSQAKRTAAGDVSLPNPPAAHPRPIQSSNGAPGAVGSRFSESIGAHGPPTSGEPAELRRKGPPRKQSATCAAPKKPCNRGRCKTTTAALPPPSSFVKSSAPCRARRRPSTGPRRLHQPEEAAREKRAAGTADPGKPGGMSRGRPPRPWTAAHHPEHAPVRGALIAPAPALREDLTAWPASPRFWRPACPCRIPPRRRSRLPSPGAPSRWRPGFRWYPPA